MHGQFELRWGLILMLAIPGITVGCGGGQFGDTSGSAGGSSSSRSGGSPGSSSTGGSASPGTGGVSPPSTGGMDGAGSGGVTGGATGGSTSSGQGGSTPSGSGGSTTGGTGGATSSGAGGSPSTGSGGSNLGGSAGTATGGAGGAGLPTPDAGVPPDPFAVAPTCTSKTTWKGGNEGSSTMNPGMACISCHKSSGEAPIFAVAGTLYPTAHEPNLCNGFSGSSAQVVITGADGKTLTLTPNSAGNFYSSNAVKLPYQAKVVYMGQERVMVETQSTGDCNSCHTQTGTNGAPGRILLP